MTQTKHYTLLPQRGLLRLSGEDTLPFLQGLVTNDVTRLHEKGILYACLLSPQGKFLHDFFLWAWPDDRVLVETEKHRMADLEQRFKMYRLRSRVSFETMPDHITVAALWPPDHIFSSETLPDPRLEALGMRAAGDRDVLAMLFQSQGYSESTPEAYRRMRLGMGVPEGSDLVPEKSFPLQFGFEDLQAVDFRKGCYVGQEVTARTKHLGQMRKFLYRVEGALLPPGGEVMLDGESAGTIVSSEGHTGLALMKVASVAESRAREEAFQVDGMPVSVTLPIWVRNTPEA
jgi:folate-binding protein YgfZ